MARVGEYAAYFYAGFDNLRKDADTLMAAAPVEQIEVNRSEYPHQASKELAHFVYLRTIIQLVFGGEEWPARKMELLFMLMMTTKQFIQIPTRRAN